MNAWLLLTEDGRGLARRIISVEIADGPYEQDLARLEIMRAQVNRATSGALARSAKTAGEVALRLLARETRRSRSVRVEFAAEPLSSGVTGASADLPFALLIYLEALRGSGDDLLDRVAFAATGKLDAYGNVEPVEGLSAKIEGALAAALPAGTLIFHPNANAAEIDAALHERCRHAGLRLCPVGCLEDALSRLGLAVRGGWTGSPFRALEPFEFQHRRIFFGRHSEIEELITLLDRRAAAGAPGALVVGGSGSGKSSFCLAGLLPALHDRTAGLLHAVWRPREALASSEARAEAEVTAAAVASSIVTGWGRSDASQSGLGLAASVESEEDLPALAAHLPQRPLIWVIDQFEELFTLNFSAEARTGLCRLIRALQAKGVWVIATLRNEFYAQYRELRDPDGTPLLTNAFGTDGMFELSRMGRDALRQVIVRPAELAGLHFDAEERDGIRLEDRILDDALAAEEALPLLEFALQQLYENAPARNLERDRALAGPSHEAGATDASMLTFKAYAALGGLRGAIGEIARRRFASLDPEARAGLGELVAALAVPAAESQREMARPAPLDQWAYGSPVRRLIDALVSIRVLISERANPDAPPQIRVAHEALFTHWRDARDELRRSREQRRTLKRLTDRAEQWRDDGEPAEWLLVRPGELELAASVAEALPDGSGHALLRTYIATSLAAQRRRERQGKSRIRRLVAAGAAALLISSSLTGWALAERNTAQASTIELARALESERKAAERERNAAARERTAAQTAREAADQARVAAVQARAARDVAERQRQLADAATAVAERARVAEAVQTKRALAGEQQATTTLRSFFAIQSEERLRGGDPFAAARYALAGLQISPENSARLRNSLATALYASGVDSAPREAGVLALAPDGNHYAVLADNKLQIVSSEGKVIATAGLTIDDFKLAAGEIPNGVNIQGAYFAGRAHLVVDLVFQARTEPKDSEYRDKPAVLVLEVEGGKSKVYHRSDLPAMNRFVFAPDMKRIVGDYDVAMLGEERRYKLAESACPIAAFNFSADAAYIATVCVDKAMSVFDLRDGKRLATLPAIEAPGVVLHGYNPVALSPDGSIVASAIGDNRLKLWRWQESLVTDLVVADGKNLSAIAFSADGRLGAVGDESGNIFLIEIASGRMLTKLSGHTAAVRSIRFSGNGTSLLSRDVFGVFRSWAFPPEVALKTAGPGSLEEESIANILSPDGQLIARLTDTSIDVADAVTGTLKSSVKLAQDLGETAKVKSLAISNDAATVLISRERGPSEADAEGQRFGEIVEVHTAQGDVRILNDKGVNEYFRGLAVSPDGAYVAAGQEARFQIWRTATAERVAELDLPNVSAVAFSQNGGQLLVGTEDGRLYVWEVATQKVVRAFALETGRTDSITVSRDGQFAAVLGAEASARSTQAVTIVDLTSRMRLAKVSLGSHVGTRYVREIAFDPSGSRIGLLNGLGQVNFLPVGFLTQDIASLQSAACTLLLEQRQRRFTSDELLEDPLLTTEWVSVERDVCEGARGAQPLDPGTRRLRQPEVPSIAARDTMMIASNYDWRPQ